MATTTRANADRTDLYGIERANSDDPGMVDKVREKQPWLDHLMRMNERYGEQGGNHFSAGITYFSVLSIFPVLMLAFSGLGFALRGNDEMMGKVENYLSDQVGGGLGDQLTQILDSAMGQAGSVGIIGLVAALWTGMSWMGNLRMGVTAMWKHQIAAQNFIKGKLSDLLHLLILFVGLVLTFAITALGSSGLTNWLIEQVNLDGVPGIHFLAPLAAIVAGLLANWLLFVILMKMLPRIEVPWRPCLEAAVIGAIGLEIIKQFGSIFFSNALGNPAGAVFGPIIGIMVVMYLLWRIVMYTAAWAATDEDSLELVTPEVPEPAVINIRQEITPEPNYKTSGTLLGVGAVLGGAVAAAASVLTRRNK
ncbi:YhjD/YihY/BrkB family envelope integrity protein [Corynebacterium ulceribovis]|uniref:YhjD/YihY/BrkB family envelope integrity protein n=1 Tax=Corynebacterium ulceribovis TaxID=487732 RepID=UPI00036E31E9|nr:YhjD/YihY/BrkB family envelope integrity protein [Corynebacterium ulceribovis]